MRRTVQGCPMCGHAVKVVGDTTQHYEPIGCNLVMDEGFLLTDDEMENLDNLLGICDTYFDVPQEGSDRAVLTEVVARWQVRRD